MHIQIFTTGGTLDKAYSDSDSTFLVDKAMASEILREAGVSFSFVSEGLLWKDSQQITAEDRQLILRKVQQCSRHHILITHGLSTLLETAQALLGMHDKVVVLTGATQPARMRHSDAHFNLGVATGALQLLGPGTYIALGGQLLDARHTRRNPKTGRLEALRDPR